MCADPRTAIASITFVALVFAPLLAAQDNTKPPVTNAKANTQVPDQAAAGSVRTFAIQHIDAGTLVSTLEKLIPPAPQDAEKSGGKTSAGGLTLACDSNTNSVIAAGPIGMLDLTARLVTELDAPVAADAAPRRDRTKLVAQSADTKPRVPPQPQQPPRQPDAAPRDDTPVRIDITVFEVAVPAEKAVLLEAETLESKSATPASLLLYRIDRMMTFVRPVDANIVANVPILSGENAVAGQKQRSFGREEVGAQFKLSGEWIEGTNRQRARLQVLSQLSGVDPSGDTLNLHAPLSNFRHVKEGFDGVIELGKPAITLSLDAVAGERPNGTAYVIRLLLTAP